MVYLSLMAGRFYVIPNNMAPHDNGDSLSLNHPHWAALSRSLALSLSGPLSVLASLSSLSLSLP